MLSDIIEMTEEGSNSHPERSISGERHYHAKTDYILDPISEKDEPKLTQLNKFKTLQYDSYN